MTADNPSFPRPAVIPAKAGIQTPVALQFDHLKLKATKAITRIEKRLPLC